ncbi:MAG: DMT family transporter [Pseudomonadota bacterium]
MTQDRPVLGMLLMFGFCILAPMGDSIAKVLGSSIPLLQLLLVRFALQALLLLPFVVLTERTFAATPRTYKLTALRTLLHIVGVGAMFLSLRYLPLADAVAIAFVMPFILLLLGRFILNEEVGPHRLAACAVGFLGTLLVIQPSFAEVGWPALLPLIVAVDFALFMLVTRAIAKDIDPISMQTISGFMAIPMLVSGIAILALFVDLETLLVVPNATQMFLLFAIGALGTIAHLLMTWSLRFAPSATLAPMQYLEIPFATVLGYLVFSDLPNGLAALGIIITICSGLYVVYREHAVSRAVTS